MKMSESTDTGGTNVLLDPMILDQLCDDNEIGQGTFGTVYQIHTLTDIGVKACALKVLSKVAIEELYDKYDTELDFHTIKHELEIIKRLDNTHVIKYMATCFTGHHIYIQMELCRCDLQELIEAKHRIFETEEELDANDGHVYVEPNDLEYFISVEMLREVAQGLQYLHDRQPPVFHRDLRPQNVFMVIDPDTNAPVLKLGDFCLDKLPALALRHHRERMSARYTAPEVNYICDEKFAFKQSADIYSLGMIVIDLFNFDFTGKRRYERLKSIWELAIALIEVKVAVRPTCNQLIDRVDDLDPMDTQLVLKQYTDYKEEFRDIENKHLDKYVSHKIALLSQSVC